MAFTVRCLYCDTLMKVPDKYHYQKITCPNCKKEIEAISSETLEVGEDFLKQLEEMEGDMIIDESHPSHQPEKPPAKKTPPSEKPDDEDIPHLKNS